MACLISIECVSHSVCTAVNNLRLDLSLCVFAFAVISSEAVTSGGAVVQQPLTDTQTVLITTAAALPATQVHCHNGPLTFAFHILALFQP